MSQAPEEAIQVLTAYSYNLGVAFQIVDDILDFTGTEKELGKPAGSDLLQGTLTLPAMMLLEQYPDVNPVEKLFNNREETDNIGLAIEQIRNSTIISQCYELAKDYCDRACRDLDMLPDKNKRRLLVELASYITRRNR